MCVRMYVLSKRDRRKSRNIYARYYVVVYTYVVRMHISHLVYRELRIFRGNVSTTRTRTRSGALLVHHSVYWVLILSQFESHSPHIPFSDTHVSSSARYFVSDSAGTLRVFTHSCSSTLFEQVLRPCLYCTSPGSGSRACGVLRELPFRIFCASLMTKRMLFRVRIYCSERIHLSYVMTRADLNAMIERVGLITRRKFPSLIIVSSITIEYRSDARTLSVRLHSSSKWFSLAQI